MKTDKPKTGFIDSLYAISAFAEKSEKVSIREILNMLSSYGPAALCVLFSFPFCLPIPLPGVSIPFGVVLILVGLQMIFTGRLWLPNWLLNKRIPGRILKKIIDKVTKYTLFLQKFIHPRPGFLTGNRSFVRLNGILITIFSVFLALPIPIPMTNFFATLPIISLGLGMLEDDGICVFVGYLLSSVSLCFFFFLIYFGFGEIESLV